MDSLHYRQEKTLLTGSTCKQEASFVSCCHVIVKLLWLLIVSTSSGGSFRNSDAFSNPKEDERSRQVAHWPFLDSRDTQAAPYQPHLGFTGLDSQRGRKGPRSWSQSRQLRL